MTPPAFREKLDQKPNEGFFLFPFARGGRSAEPAVVPPLVLADQE